MGVRKIRATGWSLTGFLPSDKNSASCDFESGLERDYATILEFDFNVAEYSEQPLKFRFTGPDKRERFGVPDFLVHYHPGLSRQPWLVDVKWRSNLFDHWSKLKSRLRAGRICAIDLGYRYKIMTEVEIRTPYLRNARFLLQFRQQHAVDRERRVRMMGLLDSLREPTPSALLTAHSRSRRAQLEFLPDIWHLVATGYLKMDLDQTLTMESHIWKAGHA